MNTSKSLPLHIFLAEDDEDDRLLFSDALLEIDSSAVLTEAENGKVLMNKLYISSSHLPEIVFLDINMPLQNGYECLQEIRSNKGNLRNLHIVVLTTDCNKDHIDAVYNLGATYYVVKPENYNGLKSVIAKLLKIDWMHQTVRPDRKHFVIQADLLHTKKSTI